MTKFGRSLFALIFLLLQAPGVQAADGLPVVVFAAASLQGSLSKIASSYTAATGKRLTLSFAASSALARQIDSGAPADLFISADEAWMDWVQTRKLIRAETRRNGLGNALVLIAGKDAPIDLKIAPGFALARALGEARLATGDTASVPAGLYAKAALTALGVWDEVRPQIAGAENVRVALELVARGEAKLGIVYATDARAEPRVRVVDTFPASSHPAIVYPFAITQASANPDAAAALEYMRSPAATAIFEADGFQVLK